MSSDTETTAVDPSRRSRGHGLELTEHAALNISPVELILLRGSDKEYEVTYTPPSLDGGNTLFWALAYDLTVTFDASIVKLPQYTVVSSLITVSATDTNPPQTPGSFDTHLLTRYDCIPEQGLIAKAVNLDAPRAAPGSSRISVFVDLFVVSKAPGSREHGLGDVCPPLIIPTDKWCKQSVMRHGESIQSLFSARYSSWADRVALVVNQNNRPLDQLTQADMQEMPDDLRSGFAGILLGNDANAAAQGIVVSRVPGQH